MFDSDSSINNVIVSLESTLKIEYPEDPKVEEVIVASVQRLENTYGCTFNTDVFTLQGESQLQADSLSAFLRDLRLGLQQLSFYISLKLFHKNLGLTLADVNYLGYGKQKLLTALKYLQDDNIYAKHASEIVKPLYGSLNNISMCTNKRLFVVLLMLERLGVSEGVSIVAQLLYIGGLVE